MKKSELKQLIKEEIRKVVSEKQTTNEILGFSKREKEIKSLKKDFDKAREEIKKYNADGLFVDFGDSTAKKELDTNKKINDVEKSLLRNYKYNLPMMYKLKTDPKYKKFGLQDGRFGGVLMNITGKWGGEYGGATLANGVDGIVKDFKMDPKGFKEEQLKSIDNAEKSLMQQMGGKFLDRT